MAASSGFPLPIRENPSAPDTGRFFVVVAATGTHAIGAESVPNKCAFFAFPGVQGERHPAAGGATQVEALSAPNMEDRIKEQEAARNGQT